MPPARRLVLSYATGLLTLAWLVGLTVTQRPAWAEAWTLLVFIPLIVFTTTFGVVLAFGHITIGRVSLLPLTTLAAYLALGPVWAGWAAWLGALAYTFLQHVLAEWLETTRAAGRREAVGLSLANAAIQTASVLAADVAFRWAGGRIPWEPLHAQEVAAFIVLSLAYLGANYLIAGGFIALRGRKALGLYARALPQTALVESAQLAFAPLVALIYLRLHLLQFVVFASGLGIVSVIIHTLARATDGLKRRVEELDTLKAVSEAVSQSLDLTITLETIWEQVARLMPAANFYVALYEAETDEVSFPLAVENNQIAHWRSRRAGNGFTEHLLRTRAPLLIPHAVGAHAQRLGLEPVGRLAQCWLGVPLLAGDGVLGVLAVQDFDAPDVYEEADAQMLAAIASQATIAIQNARLYSQTDAALARRVQELDSILRTVGEGVLLFDADWRVVAANRALATALQMTPAELAGRWLWPSKPSSAEPPLLPLLGYTLEALRADCHLLADPAAEPRQKVLALPSAPGRYAERTLAPVRQNDGRIAGWLLMLRDVTEEQELARLREDMTQMLVHDLRSPLSAIISSLRLLPDFLANQDQASAREMLGFAQVGSDRLMNLVNTLLDISKLEKGEMQLQLEWVEVETLLRTTAERLAPLAEAANITVEVRPGPPEMPLVRADPDLLGRALHNLLDNALKFTPDGGQVTLWARLDSAAQPPGVQLGVSDDGPGIPVEAQAKIFKKFEQGGSAQGRRRGTGLGLSFCKLVAEAHGGKIGVESAPGQGATFAMSLPAGEELSASEPRE